MKLLLVLVLLTSTIFSSLHSLNKYLLSIYVPGIPLGTGNAAMKESEWVQVVMEQL